MNLKIIFITLILIFSIGAFAKNPTPAPVNEYKIHRDGGLIYNPLSTEASAIGELAKFDIAPKIERIANINGYEVKFQIPTEANAYDVMPIEYSINFSNNADLSSQLAITANCFEEPKKYKQGIGFFDLNTPGKMEITPEFLGTITANIVNGRRNIMKPDLTDKPGIYPNFKRNPMKVSGTIEAGDIIWFKYRFKNTGNTIIDPEGFGGALFMCDISKKNSNGEWGWAGRLYNQYGRIDKYLYPGESTDVWFCFNNDKGELDGKTPQNYGLIHGEYKIKITFVARWTKDVNEPFANQWFGSPFTTFEQSFNVEKKAKKTPVKKGIIIQQDTDPNHIPGWLHHFEEFMSGMNVWQNFTEEDFTNDGTVKGKVYVQVSPWAKNMTCKIIDRKGNINIVNTPININSDILSVEYQSKHQVQRIIDGMRHPVIYTQNMADMRMNLHHSPYPEKLIWERMKEMKDCGINLIATTSMPWLYDFIKGHYIYSQANEISNQQGDAMKYFLDIARKENIQVTGWGQYPFNRFSIGEIYNWLNDTNEEFENASHMELSYFEPKLPKANAALWLYQFARWGDLYYQTESGLVPFDVEDTRGWMRQDVNIRYPMGAMTIKAFQNWCKEKYDNIEVLNSAWNSKFNDFSEIEPERDSTPNRFNQIYEYFDKNKVFHDWSPAMNDLDFFRSELRVQNYKDTLDIVRKEIPGATVTIRTEGGNFLINDLDPTDPNPHIRHAFYSQRRAAVMAEEFQKSDVVKFHSDYVTLPYTPREIFGLTKRGVDQGIIPMQLPQFDHMRDIAINDKYGTDFQINFNLPEPKKGIMMHVLTPVFPWWKALYEAGGVPGITWEDLECDGVVFETQRKEMKLFKNRLETSMNTPENITLRKTDIKMPEYDFRSKSKAKNSFIIDENVLKIKEY